MDFYTPGASYFLYFLADFVSLIAKAGTCTFSTLLGLVVIKKSDNVAAEPSSPQSTPALMTPA